MGNWQGAKVNTGNVLRIKHAGKQIKKSYHVSEKIIGKGAFAKVYMGQSTANPQLKVAVKTINKLYLGQDDLKAIGDEVEVLQALDHPNIVKYFETYEDPKFMFIVTELCKGNTLGHQLKKNKRFSESDTAYILQQLVSAIHHWHANKVSHRDIKPDNIMVDFDLNVTLIDFGLSKLTTKNRLKSVIGSPLYMAPEIFDANYTKKCDIWSLGVLIYHMIAGCLPFKGDTIQEVHKKAKTCRLEFSDHAWNGVTSEWIDLIKKMIVVDPKERLSAEEVLSHPWFDMFGSQSTQGDSSGSSKNILETIRNFQWNSHLKKACLHILVKMIKRKDLEDLNYEFELIDEDQDGMISFEELKEALVRWGIPITDTEIQTIISKCDFSKNNAINYTEFLVMTLDQSKVANEDSVNSLLKHFDRDEKGFITKVDIMNALQKGGKKLKTSELKEIMRMHDPSKRGYITYSEFKQLILNS